MSGELSNYDSPGLKNNRPCIADQNLSLKIDKIIDKLEALYPEHKVFALDSIDKELRERISNCSKQLGYNSVDLLLNAYGFEKITGDEVKKIRPYVIYTPGNEPEIIKNRVKSILSRLEEYYPSKIIEGSIQNNHKSLSSSISGVYQWLGYASAGEFLKAYGYEYKTGEGGRPSTTNVDEVIDELRQRSSGTAYSGMKELLEANPDLRGKIKTIQNKSNAVFGMSFLNYLKNEGIIETKSKVESNTKVVKPQKYSSISRNAFLILCERYENEMYEISFSEAIEQLVGVVVKTKPDSNIISVVGTSQKTEFINIPSGVDQIADKAFAGNKDIKKIVISASVCSIGKNAFEDCDGLSEVIIKNPKCKIHPSAFLGCSGLSINIDRTEIIDTFLARISDKYKDNYSKCIKDMNRIFENVGGRPEGFWAGEDWKFAFSIGQVLYQTPIEPLFGDYEAIDSILINVFGFERVRGTIEYYKDLKTGSNTIDKIIQLD